MPAVSSYILIICFLFALPLEAKERLTGPIPATSLKVLDGDTIDVSAQVWLGQHIKTRVRLLGLDTPELRGKCSQEKLLAEQAKKFVDDQVSGKSLILKNIHYGKYAGRILANVELENGKDLTQLIIQYGFGRPYQGGQRTSWCP